jgi:PmbA protein
MNLSMAKTAFSYTLDELKSMSQDMLSIAKKQGASAAEVDVSLSIGQSVSVRLGETENIEYNRDKGLSVTVYFGEQKGNASTSDLSKNAMQDTVLAACNIAKYTAKDPFCGLADASLLATDIIDCDLYHPWDVSVDDALAQAKACEDAARAVDSRINNSEGASVSTGSGMFAYSNSNGFSGGYASTRHGMSAAIIAEANGEMQRDYWYTTARDAQDLLSAEVVGKMAGERAVRRLNPQKIKTAQVPVIFEAPLASGLISSLISAIAGGNLYRKSSFLLDSLGKQVASPLLNIVEDPFVLKGLASSPFDNEGVQTKKRTLVENGVLQGYLLGSYSARKLGMQTTGNAGGSHNLIIESGDQDLASLLNTMGTGLLVTELLGHGLNMVTGDYSRGAAGFWVENGVIAYPVEGVTIASNMADMLKGIEAIGNDVLVQGSRQVGSILIDKMTVASE